MSSSWSVRKCIKTLNFFPLSKWVHTFLSWLILAYHIWNMMRLLPLKRIWEKGKKVKLNLQLSSIRYVDLWSVENALRDHKIHDSWKECWRFGEFGQKSSIQYHLKLLLISIHAPNSTFRKLILLFILFIFE